MIFLKMRRLLAFTTIFLLSLSFAFPQFSEKKFGKVILLSKLDSLSFYMDANYYWRWAMTVEPILPDTSQKDFQKLYIYLQNSDTVLFSSYQFLPRPIMDKKLLKRQIKVVAPNGEVLKVIRITRKRVTKVYLRRAGGSWIEYYIIFNKHRKVFWHKKWLWKA